MSSIKKDAIYTDNPNTIVLEKILQDQGIPDEDADRIGGLTWALDYMTGSTTKLTQKDIKSIMMNIDALAFDELTRHAPWMTKTSKAQDYFKLRSLFVLKRSEGGFLIEKAFGKTLSEANVSVQEEGKKRRLFRW